MENPIIVSKTKINQCPHIDSFLNLYSIQRIDRAELVEIIERGLFYGKFDPKFTSCVNPYTKSPSLRDYQNLVDKVKEWVC